MTATTSRIRHEPRRRGGDQPFRVYTQCPYCRTSQYAGLGDRFTVDTWSLGGPMWDPRAQSMRLHIETVIDRYCWGCAQQWPETMQQQYTGRSERW